MTFRVESLDQIYNSDVDEKVITMQRGHWYLTDPAQVQPRYLWNNNKRNSSIIHCCNPHAVAQPTMSFPVDYLAHARANRTKPAWRCSCCYKKPPESILTVFILQNFDWVSEEIQRTMEYV